MWLLQPRPWCRNQSLCKACAVQTSGAEEDQTEAGTCTAKGPRLARTHTQRPLLWREGPRMPGRGFATEVPEQAGVGDSGNFSGNQHTFFSHPGASGGGPMPPAKATGRPRGLVWQARESDVPLEGPLAPSSSPLLSQPPLWALLLDAQCGRLGCPRARKSPVATALGFSVPAAPELWLHGRPTGALQSPTPTPGAKCLLGGAPPVSPLLTGL